MSSVTVIVGRVVARDERFALNFDFSGLVVSLNQHLYLAACAFQPSLRATGCNFEARMPRRHRSLRPANFSVSASLPPTVSKIRNPAYLLNCRAWSGAEAILLHLM